jgi:hypothetical protein
MLSNFKNDFLRTFSQHLHTVSDARCFSCEPVACPYVKLRGFAAKIPATVQKVSEQLESNRRAPQLVANDQ